MRHFIKKIFEEKKTILRLKRQKEKEEREKIRDRIKKNKGKEFIITVSLLTERYTKKYRAYALIIKRKAALMIYQVQKQYKILNNKNVLEVRGMSRV